MKHLKIYTKQDILNLTKLRSFETKIGEQIQYVEDSNALETAIANSSVRYVLLGIPEDIGVLANDGIGGTDTSWPSFLQSFLNIQSNDFLSGEEILLLGHFDFSDIKKLIEKNAITKEEKINAYKHAVLTIDEAVEDIIKIITTHNKIPIVIGGGHNNAYPLIKGAAKGLHKADLILLAQINCINVDAHADYRPMEGRHSGNAFRYAEEDGYLQKYCVIGIHENYIPENVWIDMVNNPFIDCITYEDIFIHEKRNFSQTVLHAINFTDDTYTGIELDMDAITNTLSSAVTPCGISSIQARQYITLAAKHTKPAYLHICEGATQLINGQKDTLTGKLISYVVSDFIKGRS
ncbi:MAG TPA: formimidoylglutamase [Chitinophagaceae bacterium]|nr:formimidoylglutamase [Chitinophagaceae bacterium]